MVVHSWRPRRNRRLESRIEADRGQVDFTDLPTPVFTGVRTVEPDLTALREMIDWQFLFLAWELKGRFPAIQDQPVARELYDDANTLLDDIVASGSFQTRGVYGFWPAHALGDDIIANGRHLPMVHQQTVKPTDAPTAAWPTTWHRPATTSAASP